MIAVKKSIVGRYNLVKLLFPFF